MRPEVAMGVQTVAMDPADVAAAQQALDLARGSLLAYIKLMFPGFRAYRHHYLLIELMEKIERGELKRLIINIPPRHTKSLICTEHFPPWAMGRDPRRQIISASYNADLAKNFGRKVQSQVQSPLYQAMFPNLGVDAAVIAVDSWDTAHRGAYNAIGVGGGVLGKGGDIIIIDDPYKNQQAAESEAEQRKVIDWYTSVIETRQQMNLDEATKNVEGMDAAIVIIHQRWNDNDLTAWILENRAYEDWTHIVLPIECDDPENDLMGRVEGEPLWPEAYGTKYIERVKRGGEYRFQSMYQQNPAPKGGRVFKEEWFKERYEKLPLDGIVKVMSLDTASSDKRKADFSACVTHHVDTSRMKLYMAEAWKEQLTYPALKRKVIDEVNVKKPHFLLIEDRNVGTGLIQELPLEITLGNMVACAIVAINPGLMDKEIRARISSSTPQNKQVLLPKEASWVKSYLTELLRFPGSKRKDFVDASSQAWTWIRENLFMVGKIEGVKRDLSGHTPNAFHTIADAMKLRRIFGGH